MRESSILMPVNQNFLDVFEVFMDENQKTKIRANNARQYIEGIIDLLLNKKIQHHLKDNEIYLGVNWKRKLKILEDHYDHDIVEQIREIFNIGGNGSHFNGAVNENELKKILEQSIHIVEEIFIKYFLEQDHLFGSEDIYTIFSMLPLSNRIYILEGIHKRYQNSQTVDRLSLAYIKFGDRKKALDLLDQSLEEKTIDEKFYNNQLERLNILEENIAELYRRNANYEQNPEYMQGLISGNHIVVGLPTANSIFDTARALEIFKCWFEEKKEKYPEFINLFFCLMASDNREYQ